MSLVEQFFDRDGIFRFYVFQMLLTRPYVFRLVLIVANNSRRLLERVEQTKIEKIIFVKIVRVPPTRYMIFIIICLYFKNGSHVPNKHVT